MSVQSTQQAVKHLQRKIIHAISVEAVNIYTSLIKLLTQEQEVIKDNSCMYLWYLLLRSCWSALVTLDQIRDT